MMPVATILKMPYAVRVALLTAVLALVIVGFLAIRVIVNHQGLDKVQSVASPSTTSDTSLAERYQSDIQKILTQYVEQVRAGSDMRAMTTQAKDSVLELKVPTSEREAHLALVLDLDAISIALDENASTSIDTVLEAIVTRLESN